MISPALTPTAPPLLATRTEQDASRTPLLELTRGLERGDDAAWAQFHREYGPMIFRQLLGATRGDHDLASEALQHAYLRVARNVKPCDVEPMFLGWLRVVARTALHDCWRRRRSFWQMLQRRQADPAAALDVDEAEEERVLVRLEDALAQLEPDARALLTAKYFSGRDVRSIAEEMQVSPKAIESRLTRARAELRRRLIAELSRHD